MKDDSCTDLVSVIIPIYNTGDLFIRCIESVIRQSYANLEIILVDDCSTDKATLELIDRYASKDTRIVVLHNSTNRGQGHARNKGVNACRGEFFTFLDSDDALSPDMIERMLESLKSSGADFAVCDGVNVPLEKDYRAREDLDYFRLNLEDRKTYKCSELIESGRLSVLPECPCCKLFRLSLYRSADLDFCEGVFYEDNDWILRLMFGMASFVYLKFDGYIRILHGASVTHRLSDRHIADRLLAYERMMAVLAQHNQINAYGRMYMRNMMECIMQSLRQSPTLTTQKACLEHFEICVSRFALRIDEDHILFSRLRQHVLYKIFKIMHDKERYERHRFFHDLIKTYIRIKRQKVST